MALLTTITCFILVVTLCTTHQSETCNQLVYIAGRAGATQLYMQKMWGRRTNLSKPFGIDRVPDILPTWSPNGTRVAYIGYLEDTNKTYIFDICLRTMKADRYALPKDCYPSHLTWSTDGTQILFTWPNNSAEELGIYQLIRATGKIKRVHALSRNADFAWSPDRTSIAFTEDSSSGGQLVIQDIFGTHREEMHENVWGGMSWSPNGRYIAFEQTSHDPSLHICWKAVDNGLSRCLDVWSRHPVWTNDSSTIAFRGRNPDDSQEWLGLADLESGIVERLAYININNAGTFYPVAWSATDEFLAYESCDSLANADSCSIWIISRDGKIHRPLNRRLLRLSGEWEPVWMPAQNVTSICLEP